MQAAFKWEWAVEIFKFVTSSKESRTFCDVIIRVTPIRNNQKSYSQIQLACNFSSELRIDLVWGNSTAKRFFALN